MNSDSIFTTLGGLAVGAAGTYVTFYLRGALARREQIAKLLSDFYSSAAAAYYAARDFESAQHEKPEDDDFAFYNLFDEHYKNFLFASTMLAALVHPDLRESVLEIEDFWDDLPKKGFSDQTSKSLFDTLDNIRYKILDSISYNRFTDPF